MEFPLESGKAVVEGEIGRGPRSIVYRAKHDLTDQALAVKVWTDAATAATFRTLAESLREAKGTARVHEVGEHEGRVFLCRDFVPGSPAGAMEPAAAAKAIRSAVLALHEAGLVHGGIKPSNVLLQPDGQAALVDFKTNTGPSAELRPPEKGRSESADLYALGKLLGRMLGPNPPAELAAVVRKATEANPGDRYLKAKGMADDLSRFLRGGPVVAAPVGGGTKAARWLQERKSLLGGIGCVVALAIFGWFFLLRKSPAERASEGLESSDPATRRAAILRVLASGQAQPPLASAMRAAPDDETRTAILDALERNGEPWAAFLRAEGGAVLGEWLARTELRPRILRLLARAKCSIQKARIFPLLTDADVESRRAALIYFAELPDQNAYDACAAAVAEDALRGDALRTIRVLYDTSIVVKFHPSEAIGLPSRIPYFLEKEAAGDERFKSVLAVELWFPAYTAADAATQALQSPDPQTRLKAAVELGLHRAGAGPLLLAAMRDPDPVIAAVSAWALGECGPDKKILQSFAEDPNPTARRSAAWLTARTSRDPE